MTVLTQRVPAGHYRFRHVARMEWIKLRTLRSTWWALAITAAGGAVMAVVIGLNTISRNADLTNNVLAGVIPGLLLIGVLGVLVITSEYTSGMIRATLAAVPRRPLLLAAKAGVFGAMALAVGEAAAFLAFFAGGAAFRHGLSAPALSQPGVLRAVLLGGASYCLIGLLGLGLGAIIRHTAAAIAVLVAGVYLIGPSHRRSRACPGRLPADLHHRELADHDHAGTVHRGRAVPALPVGVGGPGRAQPVRGRGAGDRRLAARSP